MLMDEDWTLAENVKVGLDKAGFTDVEVWEEDCSWRWEGAEAVSKYFFDGGNPANLRTINSFKARGGNVGEVRPIFERLMKEEWGREDGEIELHVPATLATARR